MDEKTLERIVKCAVAWNKGLKFDKDFLKIFDDMDLIIEEDEKTLKLKIRM